ncbi:Rib/alpha-like domain-containing protein [Aerococcus tenax]|uniref:Rib/alpha-like domain-containing protein n=1 Tax=Aerococcus tenax TaxID=3078812 RepID=UPI0015ECA1F6|nr:Rib/alpha-like domain-containing protein [Aerococcus urinae]
MVGKNNLKVKKEKQSNKFYRYSIRRLSVGVASVAVAAGLLFASDSAVAQAATNEVKASAVETTSAPDPVAETKLSEAVTAPAASPAEDKSVPTPVAEETKLTEEKAEAKPAQPEADKKSEEKTQVEKVKADAEAEKTEAKKAEESAKSEKETKVEEQSKPENVKADKKAEEKPKANKEVKPEEQPKVKKPTSRAAYYAEDQKGSEDKIKSDELKSDVKNEGLSFYANVDTTNSDKTLVGESELLKKLQDSAIDATGKQGDKRSYSGTVFVYRHGNSNEVTKETLAGVPVYLQWAYKDGYVSPVYKTVSKADGTFTFTFDKPVIDKFGNVHKWKLSDGDQEAFAVRTWAENPDPAHLALIKGGDQITGFHKRLTRTNESWDFTVGIDRIVNGQVVFQEKLLNNDWLVGPKDTWRVSPDPSGEWKDKGPYGTVRGNVWFDGGDPAGSDARMWKKDSWDLPAAKTKVVASYVNDEVARLFDKWKKDNNYTGSKGQDNPRILEFRDAQSQIIADYEAKHGKGSHIAETVVGTVDSNGHYYIPFRGLYGVSRDKENSGARVSYTVKPEQYGKVVDIKDETHDNLMAWNGTIGQKHRHINQDYMYVASLIDNYNIWSNTSQNNVFALLDGAAKPVGPSNLASGNISDVNFAAIVAKPAHAVKTYDAQSNFAPAGTKVENSSEGLLPSTTYFQRWFKDGKPYGEATEFVTTPDGKAPASIPVNVDKQLGAPAKFTSAIFLNDGSKHDNLTNALAADAFIAAPKVEYDPIEKKAGQEAKTAAPKYKNTAGEEYTPNPNDGKPTFSYEERKETVDKNGETKISYQPLKTVNVDGNDIPVSVDPKTGEVTIKASDTAKIPGKTVTVPVTLTYPNGMKIQCNAVIKVLPKEEEKDLVDPKYTPVQSNVGEEVTSSPQFIDKAGKDTAKPEDAKFALGENAPEGAKVDPNTGVVTYTAKAADAGTMVSVPVVVTYKDGSQETTNAPVIVAEQDKIKDVTDPNSPVPEGYVRLKFNADSKDGSVTGKFADNSKVKAFDVLKGTKFNDPEIQTKFDQVVPTNPVADNPAKKWSSWEPIFDNELAKDTSIEEGLQGDTREYHSVYEDKRFNEDNVGIAKVEIVQDPTKKEYTEGKAGDNKLDPAGTKVKLTDANGIEKVVEPKDFDKYGIKVGLKDVPNYTPETPLTKKDHDGKKVEVTVPGKNSELKAESKAPITVKQQDKDALEPSYAPTEANVGQAAKSKAPSFKDSANKAVKQPAGVKFALGEGAPKGATIDPKTGEVSYTPQAADEGKDVTVPVVVTYGDKTTDTTEAVFNVTIRPDVYKPTDPNAPVPEGYHKVTLKAGEGTQVAEKVLHVRDGKGISADSYPEATIDPAKAKDYKEPITWSIAPDTPISKDEVIVANATKKTDAEKNQPQAKAQTVKVGETPKAEDSIANLKDLPQGTKVAYKEPVDTKTPGDKAVTVVVTYPDGTTDEVPATVKVKDLTDAEKNEPQAKDQTVKVGETPKAEDSIANLKDLPEGTKVAYKEPVDTKTPGEKSATVVVTYPDGSSEEVPVKVQVKDLTDAEKNNPQGQDINAKVGETPDAKAGIKDADKLPQGTKFDFKEPVDTKTPGDKPATVVVTYPDGSKDEVPVNVKVSENPTQAETTDPTVPAKTEVEDKTNLTPEEQAKVKKAIEDANKDKFPAPKEGQKPTTVEVGKDGTATITYPDGSKDTIPGTDLVVERPKTTVEGTPKTVKPTNDPQDTGLVVKNQDDKTPTTVTAKDEDGQDVPVTVDPETGKVSVTPGTKVDGPITVTVEDKDIPDGKQTFEVPVEGHEKGHDDNGSDKTQADLTDPTVPAKTEVEDKTNLTPEEQAEVKKKVEDANKDKFPVAKEGQKPTTVEVGKDGTATITYPDGSKDTITGTDLVVERPKTTVEGTPKPVKPTNDPQDTGLVVKNQDDKTPTKVTAKDEDGNDVPVTVDPETGKVSVTPGTKVDGPINVTVEDKDLPEGKKSFEVPVEGHEKGRDDNNSGKTQADLTDPSVPAKTEVEDKTNLTPEEQAKVKKAIEDANKDKFPAPTDGQTPTTVEVGKDGTATITYPDGSKDTIPGTDLVVERPKTTVEGSPKTVKPTNDPQDTGLVVKNQDDKTPTKVTAKDEDGQDVPVTVDPTTGKVSVTPGTKVDGPITVTVEDKDLPEGKQNFVVPVEGHEAGRDDNGTDKTQADLTDPTVPAKTEVEDKTNLTPEEQAKVKKAIEDANKDKFPVAKEGQNPTTVEVGKDGTATITYPDGSKDTIPGTDLVVERPKTTVEGTPKTVKPTNEPQDTGLVVKNQDDKTPTKVTAKDEDGNDVPVTVDPTTGKVSVTPGTKVDGPITVTVEDKDLPEGKQDFVVPVEGHEAGRDDNGSDKTQADLTDPVVPAEKTPVADKTNLTDDEKVQVKKAIEDANKDKFPAPKEGQNPTTIEIGNDGTATITYPDGSKDTIPGDQLVREKTNVDDSVVKPIDPTDEQQGTGIKVNNPDKDTKVTAKDEDGKNVPVVINPETGEVEVTPGANVDGPITVTVEDPDLPGGKQEVTVPVKGHEAGRDDNGSDEPNTSSETVEKTTVDDSQVKEVNPTDEQQGTGIKVNNPDKDTKVTAKDEDGKNIPVVINPTTGEVEVTPGTDVDGPIIVTITDPELPGGKKVVVVPVKSHAAGRDDNHSEASSKPATTKPNTVKPGQPGHGNQVAQPVHTNTGVQAVTTKAGQSSQAKASSAKVHSQLPQTGAVAGLASSLALALIGAGSILALGKRRKED